MEIKVNVNGQKMKLVNSSRQIVAGSQEFILIKFTFSSDWDGLSILAKFAQEGNDIDVIVENGQCYFPRLIGPGKCILSVVGIGTSKVATADTITFDVKKSYSIGEGGLDLPYDGITTVAELKAYLVSNPITILGERATPIIEIIDIPTLKTKAPKANVFIQTSLDTDIEWEILTASSNDLQVEELKKRIEALESALIGE